jgi:hypothetical protein
MARTAKLDILLFIRAELRRPDIIIMVLAAVEKESVVHAVVSHGVECSTHSTSFIK